MKKILNIHKKKFFGIIIVAVLFYGAFSVTSLLAARQILKQTRILHEMGETPLPKEGQKILVFSPHPDDESIGAGGYIETATENGANVKIVLVTNGNKRKIQALRIKEFESATRLLGVSKENLMYLNYADGSLKNQNNEKLKSQLAGIIDQNKPDIIFSPYSKDTHSDHSTLGKILEEISKEKNIKTNEYLVHTKKFPANSGFSPNLYVIPPANLASEPNWKNFYLSGDAERTKSKAISIYRSQIVSPWIQALFKSMIRRNELYLEVS